MRIFRILGIVGTSAALLLSASAAFAHDHEPISLNQGVGEPEKVRAALLRPALATTTVREKVMDKERERVQELRVDAKAKMEAAREDAKVRVEAAREDAKVRVETAREDAKERVEAAREKAKERAEDMREKAKQRMEDIKDRTKQQMALRIADQFDHINTAWTNRFAQVLDRYDAILEKIRQRADAAAGAGASIASATAAIANAQSAIQTARDAVAAQAAMTYALDPVSVTATATATTTSNGQDELVNALRSAFRNQHNALFTDLFALRDGPMKNARQAVRAALETLKQIPKIDDEDSATTTPVSGN